MQIRLKQTKVYYFFYSLSEKKTSLKPLKAAFQIFIPCDNWKTFFIQIYRYREVFYNHHVLAFFETSVLQYC